MSDSSHFAIPIFCTEVVDNYSGWDFDQTEQLLLIRIGDRELRCRKDASDTFSREIFRGE